MRGSALVLCLTLGAVSAAGAQSAEHEARRAALLRVEGTVLRVQIPEQGRGAAPALIAVIETGSGEELALALAPESTLAEIGFEIAVGDKVRARVFEPDPEHATHLRGVQKIQNLTRGTMTRLRTLYRVPLWSNAGRWQGAPMRGGSAGGSGQRHRGGR